MCVCEGVGAGHISRCVTQRLGREAKDATEVQQIKKASFATSATGSSSSSTRRRRIGRRAAGLETTHLTSGGAQLTPNPSGVPGPEEEEGEKEMLWGLTLAVAVVCVGGVKDDVMSRLILPRDYGVKLCGREFIRAVIFTCGGSRWKRSTEGDQDPLQWSPLSGSRVEDNWQTWQPSSYLAEDTHPALPLSSSYSLADLLNLFKAVGVRGRRSLGDLLQSSQPSVLLGGGDWDPATADQPQTNRWRRNFSLGVAGKCCSLGCTKNDIGRLC